MQRVEVGRALEVIVFVAAEVDQLANAARVIGIEVETDVVRARRGGHETTTGPEIWKTPAATSNVFVSGVGARARLSKTTRAPPCQWQQRSACARLFEPRLTPHT